MFATRAGFVVKAVFADRVVVAAAGVVVLLAATVVAAIPIYATAVAASTLHGRLERAPVTAANVQASVDVFGGGAGAGADARVRTLARDTFGGLGVTTYRSGESEPFRARGRTTAFAFFDGIARHARLLSGRWPGGAAPTEVAVGTGVARTLGLREGALVRARDRLNGREVVARVVGIYRPERPTSVYWWRAPYTAGAAGPLVVSAASFFRLGLQDATLRWRLQPSLHRLTIGEATPLRRKLDALPRRLNAGRPAGQQFTLDTNLPDILGNASRSLHLARAGVLVPSIQLVLLALYGLVFTASLLVERRARMTESLRLRGATPAQIAMLSLAQAVALAVPAVAVAPWLAAAALHALNHVGPLTGIGFRLDPRVSATSYGLAAAAAAVCVLALVVPSLRTRRLSVAGEPTRSAAVGFAQRVRLDLVVAALAVVAYWQLRRYHGVLVAHRGGLGIDPFLVAAPAVLLLAGALLSLRLVPFAAASVERVVARARGTVAALGFWQLGRRPRAYARSVLLLALAIAIGIFAVTYSSTWHRSQRDQATFAAGADVRVQAGDVAGGPPTIDLASTYRSLGANVVLPAARDTFDLSRFGTQSGNVLALDARRAARVVHVRGDFASRPLAELLRPLARERWTVAELRLPGRPAKLALTAQLHMGAPRVVARGVFGGLLYLPQPSLTLYLRDADGVTYLYRVRGFGAAAPRRAEISLVHRLPDGRLARPRYPIGVVALELDLATPSVGSRSATLTVEKLETAAAPDAAWRHVPLAGGWRAVAVPPRFPYELPRVDRVSASGGAVRAAFATGSGGEGAGFGGNHSTTVFFLRPGRDARPAAPPILVSDRTLGAIDARVGQVVHLALGSGTQTVRIAGTFHEFPTLAPNTPAAIVDLPTYDSLVFASQGTVTPPAEWWLRSSRDDLAAALRAPALHTVGLVSRRERERALLDDPIPLGVIGALTLAFVVAAGFGAVAFAAGIAAAARSRTLEFAVLRALGLRTRQLSAWVALESALVVVLSLAAGTALGLIVSWLVLPDVSLGSSGGTTVPPVRVVVPWTTVAWIELALLAALTSIVLAQVWLVRGLRLATTFRGGEGALAT